MTLRIAELINDSIVDGPGIRLSVFFQGCPHRCPGCHNPTAWSFEGGKEYTPEAIFALLKKNPLADGLTLTGGEPFAQAEGAAALAKLAKDAGYSVVTYTGYTWEELIAGPPEQRALLESTDLLVDGPYVASLRSLALVFRGSSNQRIIDVPASLAAGEVVERIFKVE